MNQEKLGALIAERRKAQGLTQRTLAEQLGVTDKAVSKWERGLSCPDITLISPLAQILGLTEGELLRGERADGPTVQLERQPIELAALTVASYAHKAERQRWAGLGQALMMGITGVLLLGCVVCLICDLAINRTVTWSPIVLASCVLAWGVAAPLYVCKRRKWLGAMVALTVLMVPFLVVLERFSPMRGWLLTLGLPLAGIGLAWLWVVVLMAASGRLRVAQVVAGALVTGIFVDMGTEWLLARLGYSDNDLWMSIISVLGVLFLVLCALSADYMIQKRRKA